MGCNWFFPLLSLKCQCTVQPWGAAYLAVSPCFALLCSKMMFLFALVFLKLLKMYKSQNALLVSTVNSPRPSAHPVRMCTYIEWRILVVWYPRIRLIQFAEVFTAEFLLNLGFLSLTREQVGSVKETLHPKTFLAGSSLDSCADKLLFFLRAYPS